MSRINLLRKKMAEKDLPCFLVFNQYNITYASGFTGHAATVLITPQHNYLLTDYRYFEQAVKEATDFNVICRDRVKQSLASLINELVEAEQIDTLGFESSHVSVQQWHEISAALNETHVVATTRLIEDLRYIKDEQEISAIKQAADIADQALADLVPQIKAGVTERELALALDHKMAQLGSQAPAFDTILLFGERSALPHGVPSERELKRGDLVLIDFGATVDGYRSDMTRTFVYGEASEQQKAIYQTVLTAQQSAIEAIEEGVTGDQLNQVSAEVLNASEYAQYQGEGLGHGVGLELHEFPFIGKGCSLTVEQGCVITIEPGIYIPGWGGIRIEDDVVLTAQGLTIINASPKSLQVLGD